jgi:hypothetical protein
MKNIINCARARELEETDASGRPEGRLSIYILVQLSPCAEYIFISNSRELINLETRFTRHYIHVCIEIIKRFSSTPNNWKGCQSNLNAIYSRRNGILDLF